MFSTSRRPLVKKKTTTSAVTATTSSSSGPAQSSSSDLPTATPSTFAPPTSTSTASDGASPAKAKVLTVTRTVVVQEKTAPRPKPPPLASSSASLKRKPVESSASARPSKRHVSSAASTSNLSSANPRARDKLSPPPRPKAPKAKVSPTKRARSADQSSDEDRSATAAEESSSDEEDVGVFGKKAMLGVVRRSVAADLDGRCEAISAEEVVLESKEKYATWFTDSAGSSEVASSWPGADSPVATIEYPGEGAQERYLLLAPRTSNEFDPIDRLLTSIRIIVDYFLTPQQSLQLFNHSPASTGFGAFLSASTSRAATPSTPTGDASTAAAPTVPLMRALEKAKAKKDGPAFFAEIDRFNRAIAELKASGAIKRNIAAMAGVPDKLWSHVAEEVYERTVAPKIETLKDYPPFSDFVYGELLPNFNSTIFHESKLGVNGNGVFVDLGSGVANCVVQAALATGAESWGFEFMPNAAKLATKQVAEAAVRFRRWGLKGGQMHAVEADFCNHPDVGPALKRADVVLVNNEVFTPDLNQKLSWLFLDLRSGTQIVSLKAFASGFKLSAYNRHSPLAIVKQGGERKYKPKSVSWKNEGGIYFIGKIDRRMVERFDAKEEQRERDKAGK